VAEGPTDARGRAEAFAAGAEASFAEVAGLVAELRAEKQLGPLGPLLVAAGHRALYAGWEPARRPELAALLRDGGQFGYARRLFARLREAGDDEGYRRQQAFCTYKDMELPAARRLDRALELLAEGGPLAQSEEAETLGIAGAVYKHRWEVEARRADLESALWCYQRGYAQVGDPYREYAGINAAFVADQLAALEEAGPGALAEAARLRARADEIRAEIVAAPRAGAGGWADATLAEAHFGLGELERARELLAGVREQTHEIWRLESTAMQLAALGRLRGLDPTAPLEALLGEAAGAIRRGQAGKVGVALSGGGYRASLFHIGVLARLAERDALRRVEVLSCVSGGSIVGAYYYLKLRRLLAAKADAEVTAADYVCLVAELADEFLAGVREDLRGKLIVNLGDDLRMLTPGYSRTDRVAALLERQFYSRIPRDDGADSAKPWRMRDLYVAPAGRGEDFSLRYENWLREAKVPILVLNATSLNTGHGWQFTASWMGEPPVGGDDKVDASRRLRRVYYRDAPGSHSEQSLAQAVAASACVPPLFPPVTIAKLYDDLDVELVDGGVYDNQGIASLLEQDCTVILVSDASGQARDEDHPSRRLLGVALRSNSVLMSRVRRAQYSELGDRLRSGVLRGLMVVHLKKGLPAPPRDWNGCQEPYSREDDALPPSYSQGEALYGIDPEVQRALAELRTDLDSFSDDEAYSLMAAGYAMARRELPAALPDLPPDPALEAAVEWPFAAALGRLAEPERDGESLVDILAVGHARFFRRFLAWRRRRKRG